MTGGPSNSGRREKLKKKGFSDDGEVCGVDGRACRRQTHLLEEARVKTIPHAPSRVASEIGGYGRVWARAMLFSGEDFTGR